jgi:hypothetical protein
MIQLQQQLSSRQREPVVFSWIKHDGWLVPALRNVSLFSDEPGARLPITGGPVPGMLHERGLFHLEQRPPSFFRRGAVVARLADPQESPQTWKEKMGLSPAHTSRVLDSYILGDSGSMLIQMKGRNKDWVWHI